MVAALLSNDSAYTAMATRSDERQFFVTPGERIASLRKARDLTQRQLAEVLEVSLEVLFGDEHAKAARGKRGPAPQWQRQIEAVAQLPRSQQQFVSRMIEMALAQASVR